jgi:HlyD family secretion protein
MVEDPSLNRPSLASLRIDDDVRGGGTRRWRIVVIGTALVVLLAIVLLAVGRRRPEVEVVKAREAEREQAPTLLNASGYVTPRRRATVAAKITGRVIEVLVDEGMAVEAGQVLARLDDSDARKRLAAAQAEEGVAEAALRDLEVRLANARRELRRQQSLERDGVSSVQALDTARTEAGSLAAQLEVARQQVASARAQVAVFRQDMENYTVRAPFGGIAVSKDAQPGEMVSPVSAGGGFTRTGISTIVDMESLEIEVDVNEANIAKVVAGQRVDATLDAYSDWHIPAKVRTVIPTADRQKATVKVRISFDRLDPRILPDMGVKVAFLGDEPGQPHRAARAVLVPAAAVRRDGGVAVVYLLAGDRAERRAVTLGASHDGEVEVLGGIRPGEVVIVDGPADLRDGRRVHVRR